MRKIAATSTKSETSTKLGFIVDFSKAQFEGLLADIGAGLDDLSMRLNQVEPAAIAAANRWFVPDFWPKRFCGLVASPSRLAKKSLTSLSTS